MYKRSALCAKLLHFKIVGILFNTRQPCILTRIQTTLELLQAYLRITLQSFFCWN